MIPKSELTDVFTIEISGVCNLKCQYCAYRFRDPKFNTLMNYSTFLEALNAADQCLKEFSPRKRVLALSHFGEPTLNSYFPSMIEEIEKRKLPYHISTNGKLLEDLVGDVLLNSKYLRFLGLSFYGSSPEEYEAYTGSKSGYKSYENFFDFLGEFVEKENSRWTSVGLAINPLALKDDNREKYARDLQNIVYGYNYTRQRKFGKYCKEWTAYVYKMKSYAGMVPLSIVDLDDNETCVKNCSWVKWPIIHANGDVGYCCQIAGHENSLGNINEQSFEEIWMSDKAKLIRANNKLGRMDLVPGCERFFKKYEEFKNG